MFDGGYQAYFCIQKKNTGGGGERKGKKRRNIEIN